MIVIWSGEAVDDLAALRAHIAEDNPAAARQVASAILRSVNDLLSGQPQMGRPGRVPGTRELIVPRTPYILPYRVRDNRIYILRVYHGARRSPDKL